MKKKSTKKMEEFGMVLLHILEKWSGKTQNYEVVVTLSQAIFDS